MNKGLKKNFYFQHSCQSNYLNQEQKVVSNLTKKNKCIVEKETRLNILFLSPCVDKP